MKRKKAVKMIVLVILLVIVIAVGGLFGFVWRMLYPKAMVTGNGEKKVLCVGDSITYGQGVVMSRKTDSYPALLAEALGEDYQVWNYGLCNRTLLEEGQMPYVDEDFAAESLAEDADIVIIMLGTNDSKKINWNAEKYEEEYIRFVQNYQNMESNPEVYIMMPPAVFAATEDEGDCDNTVVRDEVVPIVARVAEQTGAGLIDLYSLTESHPEWFADGLHPNADGNRAIAETICGQLEK